MRVDEGRKGWKYSRDTSEVVKARTAEVRSGTEKERKGSKIMPGMIGRKTLKLVRSTVLVGW